MASEFVEQVANETGVSVCVASVFLGLSTPLRAVIVGFLQTQRATLIAEKAKVVGWIAQADVISDAIGNATQALRVAMAPYDKILSSIPFAAMASNCPEVTESIGKIFDSVPTKIPSTAFTQSLGIDGFEVFNGVNSYGDMKDKLNELSFRLQRSTSASAKANTVSSTIDRNLDTIDKYLAVLARAQ